MKKIIVVLLLCAVAAFALMPQAVAAADIPYAAEVPLHTYRAHGGDRGEIQQTFEALVAALEKGEDGAAFVADGVAKDAFAAYFEKLAGLKGFAFKEVRINHFYQVKDKDVHYDFRGFASLVYQAETDGKVMQYCDVLALAKQGPKPTDWKIWAVAWSDPGVDVSDIPLIQLEPPKAGEEICIIETDIGDIKLRLFPEAAPKTVENFETLAKEGYYDGMPFNRVYTDFMIQTGQLDGSGKESESSFGGFFDDEFAPNLFHFRGAVAMGNTGPNTNGNQFFIAQKPTANEEHLSLCSHPENVKAKYREIGGLPYLDFRYTIFGQVYEGLDLIDKIAAQEADEDGMPVKDPIKMITIRFEKAE